ncbi:Crp/Fnr family transcriptional regulator [Lutispora thermophila]|uniref:cAMP-binding domain of CRP or a regulatory subunit of cAMP-dependent protein kinases n=1 Tax=Lutispora thermophila DSM 19022 TaxID=1122184 RepID=A0A1M6D9I6_9FIRM|nr:Crp/Fnr family transcriptional regulator [Lutispora thermophila]SHI69800.1 cAMP-binding domain of CRP or a regulatory subunit of cAMP-dependent protein kinases [Lutispora thermophila DSM 19022]
MYTKWLNVLSACPLFNGINQQDLNNMLECIKPKIDKYEKNEPIKIAGDEFKGLGIMLSGSAAVTKENSVGDRVIITIVEAGDMFGEMAAFSDLKQWPATVIAQESSNVMYLPSDKILGQCAATCNSHRLLIMNMLKVVSNKALLLSKKLDYLSKKSIRGRISSLLLDHYNKIGTMSFMMSLNRNEMADYLNVSRPALSRELCKMRDEGVLDFYKSSVIIKDIEALKLMAE